MRDTLIRKSQNNHMTIHVLLGIICGLLVERLYPSEEAKKLVLIGVLGNIFPDGDHLLYWFYYGRKTEYSKMVKQLLRKFKLRGVWRFCTNNHKELTSLYSHNLAAPLLTFVPFLYFQNNDTHIYLQIFLLSWTVHYIYDILEDLLMLGHLNPNWYFHFKK